MKPEELLKSITDMAEALRSDMASQIGKLNEKCDALADSVSKTKKRRDDEGYDDPDGTRAARVAADSVDPSAFAALKSSVDDMKRRQSRPMADLNAFADVQSKADAVLRTHGERAEPPMSGEDLVAYNVRMHRKMQPHSAKWKGVDLSLIAADGKAFNNVLAEIRADAMQAGMNPVGLPEFQHRMITEQMPGGHVMHRWVGTGTIFKQLSRPRPSRRSHRTAFRGPVMTAATLRTA